MKKMKNLRKCCGRKVTAVLLSLTFIFTAGAGNALPAAVDSEKAQPDRARIKTGIPREIGKIEESFDSGAPKKIFFIRDAHDSYEAQTNIAKIVEHLVEAENVGTVFEEGYEGTVPTDEFFGPIENSGIKEKVARDLMDRLRIGGAEFAHITRDRDFKLIGADSVKLHLETVRLWREFSKVKSQTVTGMERIQKEILNLADKHLPGEIREWLKLKRMLDGGKLRLVEYLRRLAVFFPDESWKTESPNVSLILDALGKTNDSEIAKGLSRISAKTFFAEVAEAEEALAGRLIKDATGREIVDWMRAFALLRRAVNFEITLPEYQAVRKTLAGFSTESLARFIAENKRKTIVISKRWQENIGLVLKFYECALLREKAAALRLDSFVEDNEKSAALVFGGFHTEGIKEILRRKNISYVIISPGITHLSKKHEKRYRDLMSGRNTFKSMAKNLALASRPLSIFEEALLLGTEPVAARIMVSASAASLGSEGFDFSNLSAVSRRISEFEDELAEEKEPEALEKIEAEITAFQNLFYAAWKRKMSEGIEEKLEELSSLSRKARENAKKESQKAVLAALRQEKPPAIAAAGPEERDMRPFETEGYHYTIERMAEFEADMDAWKIIEGANPGIQGKVKKVLLAFFGSEDEPLEQGKDYSVIDGRSVRISLKKPVTIGGVEMRELILKGAAFSRDDLKEVFNVPVERAKEFMSLDSQLVFDENGEAFAVPRGTETKYALGFIDARIEYDMGRESFFDSAAPVDILPVMLVRYTDEEVKGVGGNDLGVVVMASPLRKLAIKGKHGLLDTQEPGVMKRITGLMAESLIKDGREDLEWRFGDYVSLLYFVLDQGGLSQEQFRDSVGEMFFRYGGTLRQFHDAGYTHGNPHPGNVVMKCKGGPKGVEVSPLMFRDFSESKEKSEMTKEQAFGYQFRDFEYAVISIMAKTYKMEERLEHLWEFLTGYFGSSKIKTVFGETVTNYELKDIFKVLNKLSGELVGAGQTEEGELINIKKVPFSEARHILIDLLREAFDESWQDGEETDASSLGISDFRDESLRSDDSRARMIEAANIFKSRYPDEYKMLSEMGALVAKPFHAVAASKLLHDAHYISETLSSKTAFSESIELMVSDEALETLEKALKKVSLLAEEAEAGNEEAGKFVSNVAVLAARQVYGKGDYKYKKAPELIGIKREGGVYIDLASGVNFASYFHGLKEGVKYVAVDGSFFIAEYLREAARIKGAEKKVEIIQGDVMTFERPEGEITTIRAKNVLTYVPEVVDKFEEMAGWLAEGGTFIFENDPSPGHRLVAVETLLKLAPKLIKEGWLFDFELAERQHAQNSDTVSLMKVSFADFGDETGDKSGTERVLAKWKEYLTSVSPDLLYCMFDLWDIEDLEEMGMTPREAYGMLEPFFDFVRTSEEDISLEVALKEAGEEMKENCLREISPMLDEDREISEGSEAEAEEDYEWDEWEASSLGGNGLKGHYTGYIYVLDGECKKMVPLRYVKVEGSIESGKPGVVMVDYEDMFYNFTDEQLDEFLALAYQLQKRYGGRTRFIIYSARLTDEELREFRELDNVFVSGEGAEESYRVYAAGRQVRPVHISSRAADPIGDLSGAFADSVDFFKYTGNKNGMLGVALLFMFQDGRLPGVSKDADGYYSIVDQSLGRMVATYESNLVLARAA